jgi:hypothetical protein
MPERRFGVSYVGVLESIVAVAIEKVSGSTGWYLPASCWYAGSAEHVQYGALGHAEVHADHGERLTGFVHLLRDRDVVVAEDAIARLHADPSQGAEDGGAVDAELLCERARGFTGSVASQQL